MALILALACLVLLSVLVIAFFHSVRADVTSSQSHADGVVSKTLAESAVNLVMAQIKQGTSNGETVAWASQPGAIRTYGQDGHPQKVYKLYSAREMTASTSTPADAAATFAEDAQLAGWESSPAIFSDLNEPYVLTSKTTFPIIDPRADTGNSATSVQGFKYTSAVEGSVVPGGASPEDQRVPMPVRWLYVLADGTLVAPTGSGKTAKVPGANSTDKKIIGRVAFWTDDESAKVNVNTAADGAFWDTPRADNLYDRNFARFQPAQYEFQAYPGHPATTSLATIFPQLTPQELYKLAPRVQYGGSNNITRSAKDFPINPADDQGRLYASLDEVRYEEADRSLQFASEVPDKDLEYARFFATAHSRAPEVNLFNKPRVAIWPIPTDESNRSHVDRLIAFCSTLGATDERYSFKRANAKSLTDDYSLINRNQQLISYLRHQMKQRVPGAGESFTTKYGADGRDQIVTQAFDYIRAANMRDPATASSFTDTGSSTYGIGYGQIQPIRIPAESGVITKGFGRAATVAEPFFMFVGIANENTRYPTDAGYTSTNVAMPPDMITAGANIGKMPAGRVAAVAYFGINFFDPSHGWSIYTPNLTYTVEGLEDFEAAVVDSGGNEVVTDLKFKTKVRETLLYSSLLTHTRHWGAAIDWRAAWSYKGFNNTRTGQGHNALSLPANGNFIFRVKPGRTGQLKITLYGGRHDTTAEPPETSKIQTILIDTKGPGDETAFTFPAPSMGGGRSPKMGGSNGRFWTSITEMYDVTNDVVRSYAPVLGDLRQVAGRVDVPVGTFKPYQWVEQPTHRMLHFSTPAAKDMPGAQFGKLVKDAAYSDKVSPIVPVNINGAKITKDQVLMEDPNNPGVRGDWDNGIAQARDGSFINKVDEGNINYDGEATNVPYFSGAQYYKESDVGRFSANRQMPSPGMFGSLPTGILGVRDGFAWQTLLFQPGPPGHYGQQEPKDHYFLDLFWMPVVEPYAISEPFSTAGKINLNFDIVPFNHITRDTGVRAVLGNEMVLAIPKSAADTYKSGTQKDNKIFRYEIDKDATLDLIKQRFGTQKKEIFHSASQICEIPLVPKGLSYNPAFWDSDAAALTGDNSRERPYTNIYPRLTTKSNVYSVHVRVQPIRKRPLDKVDEFVETRDQISGEWRGSYTIERFIDPSDPALPDFATSSGETVDNYYRFRTVAVKQFLP
jgi:uncharacterized protein (TIGR02600 family)